MARYQYTPLSKTPGRDSIRLATIYSGVGHDDVVVSLHTEDFTPEDPPNYEALSYVWGSMKSRKVVYVGSSDKKTLRVTKNLQIALQNLRYPDKERVMWIDALCIDQSNNVEKGPQVALMGHLFECASRVVVWLGPEENGSGLAMERLAHIGSQIHVDWGGVHRISPAGDVEGVDRTVADPKVDLPMDTAQSMAVAHLLHRKWFDRLWIRQEIFVAENRAIVRCGPHEVPWPIFRKALRLIYSKRPKPGNALHLLGNRLTTIGGFVFQMRWTEILTIRQSFQHALCSDPRDRIYGIRALLPRDQRDLCGTPDYTKSTVEVYCNLAQKYITTYPNGLTILRNCEPSPGWQGPSWVPDWSTKASFFWRHHTCASSQIQGWFKFPNAGTIRVLAASVTVVKDMRSVPQFYTRNWEIGAAFLCSIADPSCQTTSYPSGGSLMRAIARTIVAGALSEFTHVQDGTYPTTEIAESVLTNVVSGVALVEKDQNMGSDAQRFFKRMDWGSGGKAFIRGTGEYVGVVPPSTRVDDEIFVIVGCQQLLVLRKHSGGNERYSIVGECYVEGCARGEPLLGRLPDHVGFSIIRNRSMVGESRRFRDLRSGDLFCEDPRLGSLGVELEEFRARLAKDPEAMLDVAPEVLRARIKGLKYIDLV